MTYGWLVGEIVRRTDPKQRHFGDFVRQEIAEPLGIADLWIGIPDAAQDRVAALYDDEVSVAPKDSPYRETTPLQVDLMADPFGRPEVRRACIPAVGAIVTARAAARFFAMLANGGALDGVRLLSPSRVAMFSERRDGYDDIDVFTRRRVPLGRGGLQLGGAPSGSSYAPRNPRALCFPGMGGSLGFADPDTGLAVAFCHNRLSDFLGNEDDVRSRVARIIEAALPKIVRC
jgi:CubicO group peptidase (beta-lactamase class C family)